MTTSTLSPQAVAQITRWTQFVAGMIVAAVLIIGGALYGSSQAQPTVISVTPITIAEARYDGQLEILQNSDGTYTAQTRRVDNGKPRAEIDTISPMGKYNVTQIMLDEFYGTVYHLSIGLKDDGSISTLDIWRTIDMQPNAMFYNGSWQDNYGRPVKMGITQQICATPDQNLVSCP